MAIINKIYGSSLMTTSINVPMEFGVKILNTDSESGDKLILDTNYKTIIDENDITSIIEFTTVPYIDYSKYDYERRRWFQVDTYNSIWRKYIVDDWVLEESKLMVSADYNDAEQIYFSMENLFKNTDEYIPFGDLTSVELKILPFQPITLSILGVPYTDITDYSFNVSPTLDHIVPDINHQFYLKDNRIYTNTDLTGYEPEDIEIKYYYNVSDINVHCIMNTNSANYSNYTPVVDYYLVKLTGQ